MSAHSEVEAHLGRKQKVFSGATAGITTQTAGNTNWSYQELKELFAVCDAEGHEVVLTAGALKIRPLNSTL